MRVFISWSKEPSKSIALALGSWLGGLVQAVEPWVSEEEIASGKRWRDEIATVLNDTDFGIICMTRANQHNPWLMFEAGALAKHLGSARVIPLYIDLDGSQVTGPLADWQGRSIDRQGVGRMVHDINAATPKPVTKEALRRLFDRMWPDFEAEVATAKASHPEPDQPRRSPENMLEEVVERVRRIEQSQPGPMRWVNSGDTVVLRSGETITVPNAPADRRLGFKLNLLRQMRKQAWEPSPEKSPVDYLEEALWDGVVDLVGDDVLTASEKAVAEDRE